MIEEVAEKFREQARSNLETHREHRPVAFLFATFNPETRKDEDCIFPVIPDGAFDERGKAIFAASLRLIAHASKATGVIFITEMWALPKATSEDVKKWAGRIHQHPERVEVLYMSIEHTRFGEKSWTAEIKRLQDEKPLLQPWVEQTWTKSAGRFTHLLPPVD